DEQLEGELHAEPFGGPGHDLGDREGVAAEVEQVVVGLHLVQFELLGEDRLDLPYELGVRRPALDGGGGGDGRGGDGGGQRQPVQRRLRVRGERRQQRDEVVAD